MPLLVTALVVGCGLEFTGPASDAQSLLQVQLRYTDIDAPSLTLLATLFPGTDAAGSPLRVLDDSLRLLDASLAPEATSSGGTRAYSAVWPVDPAMDLGWIALQPPRVGPEPFAGPVGFGLVRRAGDRTVWVEPGDTIVLLVHAGGESRPHPKSAAWELEIREDGLSSRLTIRNEGSPPSRLAVSSEWVSGAAVALSAQLRTTEFWETESANGDYRVEIAARSEIHWIIQVGQ